MIIPEVINNYNVYNEGNRIIGIGDELPLPSFNKKTATITGAGFLGEMEMPVVGHFKSMEVEIPFRVLNKEVFELLSDTVNLTIRGSEQNTDTEKNATTHTQVRIVIKGNNKDFEGGKMKLAEGTDTKLKVELWYILIEIDGEQMLEIDKFNSKYNVCGKDMLAEVNKYC